MSHKTELVTIIYYCDKSIELFHHIGHFETSKTGRIILPDSFKKGKSIVAVCRGEVDIMNKIGDRILPNEDVA
ncbi:TIGR02922 family protein [Thalassotalea hakodatensis]|uniref:TIGR02922 family protein n=1 Tax=Thalassotalea hakodatensis TaxID=3030492 RepID=UPI00257246E0|nr:TIGR02922 family protein [Thalassotalea hakodatensis]